MTGGDLDRGDTNPGLVADRLERAADIEAAVAFNDCPDRCRGDRRDIVGRVDLWHSKKGRRWIVR